MFLADYNSKISCGNYDNLFNFDEFDKTSHALKVLNEEFEAAMKRANERLLADGYGEGNLPDSMVKPESGETSLSGNLILASVEPPSQADTTPNKDLSSSKDNVVRII